MGDSRGSQKLGDAWPRPVRMETFLTLETRTSLLTSVTTVNLVVLGQTIGASVD